MTRLALAVLVALVGAAALWAAGWVSGWPA
jgi:hypothetical protein